MSDPSQRPLVTIPRPPVSSTLAPHQPYFSALQTLTPSLVLDTRGNSTSPPDIASIIGNRPLTYTEYIIPGPDSTSLTLATFRKSEPPRTDTDQQVRRAKPCLLYAHGGGMMFGDRFHLIDFPLSLATDLDAIIVIPEYRLIPEHPSPAAVEDCYAALEWTFEHADELGVDRERVMLGGLSGGGAVAAGCALMWRDRKVRNGGERQATELCGVWLSCPMLDHRGGTRSLLQYPDANVTSFFLAKAWEFALGKDHLTKRNEDEAKIDGEDVLGYASPAVAKHLYFPRLRWFLDVGSAESLRDEVMRFAERLWEAGTQAELHVWEGGFHGFEEVVKDDELSIKCRKARFEWIRKVWALD